MARPTERDLRPLGPFPGGANNIANESSLPRGQCRSGDNIDWYPGGRWRRRPGFTRVNSINGGANSGWNNRAEDYALMRTGTLLQRFVVGQAPLTILSGIDPENPMVYCEVNQYIFVSDGVRSWRVDPMTDGVRAWGLSEPIGQPTLAASANGGFEAGKYQVTLTFVDAAKEESGARIAQTILVPDNGGIDLSNIPQPVDAGIVGIRVYMTKPNGNILRRVATLPAGTMTYHINRLPLGSPLRSHMMSAIPGVTAAAFSGGRFWFAIGAMVGYSDSLYYGLWNPALNYFSYPVDVSMLAPAQMHQASVASAGIFVGTFVQRGNDAPAGGTYFLSGTSPDDYRNVSAYRSGAIPGMLIYAPGCHFQDQNIPDDVVPVWAATNGGVMVGLPTGVAKCLTDSKFAMAVGPRGSMAFRELDGIRQLLFTMEPGAVLPINASDSLTIERTKNGITQQ